MNRSGPHRTGGNSPNQLPPMEMRRAVRQGEDPEGKKLRSARGRSGSGPKKVRRVLWPNEKPAPSEPNISNPKGEKLRRLYAGIPLEETIEEILKAKEELRESKNNNHEQELGIPLEKYSPKGRKLRKAFERPRPDLPSSAPVNRTRKQVAVTLPPDLIEEVTAKCQELDVDRTSFIEAAIRMALKPS
ncbi:ribbon-helix-helix protein, CopG family [Aquibium carbonis]